MDKYHDYVLPRMENFNAYCQNNCVLEHISKSLTEQKRNEKTRKLSNI
jgi:hypothetical protein